MELYDELVARGLIAQVTDEKEIKELIISVLIRQLTVFMWGILWLSVL